MSGSRWNSQGGGIKTDKDLGEDFKEATEGEPPKEQPDMPGKEETEWPTKEHEIPPPKSPWNRRSQESNKPQEPNKDGPSPK